MQEIKLNNIGPFWEKHPDVWPGVKRYIDTDPHGDVRECWERNTEGVMVDVTAREQARVEMLRATEALNKFVQEDEDDD